MKVVLLVFPLVFAVCPSTLIIASSDSAQVERGPGQYTSVFLINQESSWVSISGANWVWESAAGSNGVYDFVSTFVLAAWMRVKIAKLTLYIAADNYYAVTLNGETVASQWSGGYDYYSQYELKDMFTGSTGLEGVYNNQLRVRVYNVDGPSGLIFKVEITY